MKRVHFVCGCGSINYMLEDWLAHWKYSAKGKMYAIKMFLLTRIELW